MPKNNIKRKSFKLVRKSNQRNEARSTLIDLRSGTHVIPSAIRVILPYTELLSRTGVVFDDYQFNLNSIFDPNSTGTGHQPLGRDQYVTFYNRYRVMSVDYDITVSNQSTSALSFAVAPTNSSTPLDLISSSEQPLAKRREMGGIAGNNTGTLTGHVDLPLLNGRSRQAYLGSDTTNALFSGSPSETMLLHVTGGSLDGSNVSYSLVARLFFDVILFDRIDLSQS